jgi:hypothetical protein
MIREEAKQAIGNSSNGKPNYQASFDLFDTDNSGKLSADEFKQMLIQLQLIENLPEDKIPEVISKFNRHKNAEITVDDFVTFAENTHFGLHESDDQVIGQTRHRQRLNVVLISSHLIPSHSILFHSV